MNLDCCLFSRGEGEWNEDMTFEQYDSLLIQHGRISGYICDVKTYELYHLSRSLMELYGLKSPEEYKGHKCYKLLQGLDAPCPFCTNDKLCEGEIYHWTHYNEKLRRTAAVGDTIIQLDGRLCRIELLYDVTEEHEQIRRLSDQLTTEEILLQGLQTLVQEADFEVAINQFLQTVGQYYRAARAYIFEFNFEKHTTSNTFEWCAPMVSREIDNLQDIPLEYIADWLKKFEEYNEFYITVLQKDLSPDSPDYRILNAQGIESLLAAPLKKDGKIVGFIGIDDPGVNNNDLTLLRSATSFVLVELEKRRLLAALERMSYTDALTGLENRNQYIKVVQDYENDPPQTLGVIFADINGLKHINDAYGHGHGDQIIRHVAQLLRRSLEDNHVFRIGGDEFAALCENMSNEAFQEKVTELRKVFHEDRVCEVSIGCTWNNGNVDADKELMQADELMYADKQIYYDAVFQRPGHAGVKGIASEVLQDIQDGLFIVYFQPQVRIKTGRIVGAEALVRKKRKDGSIIPPDKFVPYYEMNGVIRHVDFHVLKTVCGVLKQWEALGMPDLRVSVNFSRVTLMEPDLISTMLRICEKHSVSPSRITIEVTESISKMDHNELRPLADAVREAGFRTSLDDFGSKYSNLAILTALTIDEIKFDKTLVDGLVHNEKSRAILKYGIQMCHEMKLSVSLAEGIETPEQMALLREYDCDYGQGYLFSKPLPLEEFNILLLKNTG